MLILNATTKSLEFKLGGSVTTNQLPFQSAYVDSTTTTYTPSTQGGLSNNTTAITIVSAPGASTQRAVKYINIYNNDTVAAVVTVQYNDNSTLRILLVVTLSAKDTLMYLDTEGWSVIDTNGQKKSLASVTQSGSWTVAATQSGTWTVQPGNTANTTAWKVDGSAVTQPVSGTVNAAQSGTWNITNVSGTVSLPTGASTAAKQPAIGTAGSASADVLTIQGVASMTKLLVTPDSVALPANQSVNVNQLAGTATSVNSGNKDAGTLRVTIATDQVQLTNALKVDGSAVTQPVSAAALPLPSGASTSAKQPALGIAGTASSDVLTIQGIASMTKLLVTPDAVALPANQSVNVNQLAGTTTSVNSGNKDAGTLRVTIATDQVQLTNALKVDGSAVTQPVSAASLPLPTGAATSAKQPALGTAGSASTDVISIQGITSMTKLLVTPDSVAVAAGTALIGTISASNETNTIYNGTTALTPKFSTIVASSSGVTTIVALVSSKKLRVLSMNLVANGAVNVKWQSHVTPTDKTGLAYLAANGGYILPYNPLGWFETISGEALDINLSGAVAVGGHLSYIEV